MHTLHQSSFCDLKSIVYYAPVIKRRADHSSSFGISSSQHIAETSPAELARPVTGCAASAASQCRRLSSTPRALSISPPHTIPQRSSTA